MCMYGCGWDIDIGPNGSEFTQEQYYESLRLLDVALKQLPNPERPSIHIYIYTTIMELGPKRPFILWFWGPNTIIVVYMDP